MFGLIRPRAKSTVVVLGMHRSGTSMVAGVVQALGVHIGDELLPAYSSNPLGHFEDREIVELDDEILLASGGAWNRPPPETALLEAEKRFRRRIAGIVRQRNSRHERWGWKDPRTVLTFPLFARHLIDPKLVVCLRESAAVARSLSYRDKTDYGDNLALCQEYGKRLASILDDFPFPRLILEYEAIRGEPEAAASRIDEFLGTGADEARLAKAASLMLDDTRLQQARVRLEKEVEGGG